MHSHSPSQLSVNSKIIRLTTQDRKLFLEELYGVMDYHPKAKINIPKKKTMRKCVFRLFPIPTENLLVL